MVIAQLNGGLGNQMFQYAAARALSLRLKSELILDTRILTARSSTRAFELASTFGIKARHATLGDFYRLLGWRACMLPFMERQKIRELLSDRVITEPHFSYWDGFERISSSCYLVGYWQSERYFKTVADLIRRDFHFSSPLSEAATRVAEKIGSCNSVSIHVRRGDYVSNPQARGYHGVCSVEYYERAISFVQQRMDQPVFFVFSDDIDWAMSNLPLPTSAQAVTCNVGSQSCNDMRLMSLCRAHIIANSSFSWWGAWLNPAPRKLVIAPHRWFASAGHDTSTLIPPDWVRL